MRKMEGKVSRPKSELKESQILRRENLVLHKLGAEEVPQVLRAPLEITTYAFISGRI